MGQVDALEASLAPTPTPSPAGTPGFDDNGRDRRPAADDGAGYVGHTDDDATTTTGTTTTATTATTTTTAMSSMTTDPAGPGRARARAGDRRRFAGAVAWPRTGLRRPRRPTWCRPPSGGPVGCDARPARAAVAEQLDALRARLAALKAELAAQSGQAAQAQSAQAAQAAASAWHCAGPPTGTAPSDATTRASG